VDRQKLGRETTKKPTQESRWGFRGMTVRDWLQLLIGPLALVLIGFLFTAQQDRRQQQIENQRAEAERELAEQRAQDEALQAYLDQMNTLLLEHDLRNSEVDSGVRTLARARTLTVLGRLDPSRKAAVMQFLAEGDLVQSEDGEPPSFRSKVPI
jgi:septal ring factor EnvC (AmiA/AmiB activator)